MPLGPLLLFDQDAPPAGDSPSGAGYYLRRRGIPVLTMYRSEASASLRRVPLWIAGSSGTAPATGENGGQPQIHWLARNVIANTAATLSVVSANAGEYFVELSASEVSQLGALSIQYRSATAIPASQYVQVVNYDSGDSTRLGVFALPNAAANVSGGLPLKGTVHSDLTVRVEGVAYSGLTIQGLSNYANISNVTLHAGTHSGATVQGISNWANISNVTLHAGTHSNVTIQGVTRVNSNVTIADANYSAVTMRVTGIVPACFQAGAIDAAALATDAGQEIADRVLLRGIASGSDTGRSVQDAFRAIRNRVNISGLTGTVYQEDDSTSAWTFSITTTDAAAISDLDPGGV